MKEKWSTCEEFGNIYINIQDEIGNVEHFGECQSEVRAEQICNGMNLLAGHDLSSVVVVDRKAMEGVKDTLGRILVRADSGDPIYPHSVLIRLAREALASLNAGGAI